jgi:hypothetical protein
MGIDESKPEFFLSKQPFKILRWTLMAIEEHLKIGRRSSQCGPANLSGDRVTVISDSTWLLTNKD